MRNHLLRFAAASAAALAIIVGAAASASACEKHDDNKPKKDKDRVSVSLSAKADCGGDVTLKVRNTSSRSDDGKHMLDATAAGKTAERVKPGKSKDLALGQIDGKKVKVEIRWANGKKKTSHVKISRPGEFKCSPKPKQDVTAHGATPGCGTITVANTELITYEYLRDGQWTSLANGTTRIGGETVIVRPVLKDGEHYQLTNPEPRTYEIAGDECPPVPQPKVKLTAGVVKTTCGGVIVPAHRQIVFKRLQGTTYVALKTGVNRLAGKTVTVRPFLRDTAHYVLTNPAARVYNLTAKCPKVVYVNRTFQVDRLMPATKAQAAVVAKLDNDGVLRYREDKPLYGHSRWQFVTVRVPVGASHASVVRAINAKTTASVGDVRTGIRLAAAAPGKTYVFAWELGRGATVSKPWGPGPKFSVAQKFFARS